MSFRMRSIISSSNEDKNSEAIKSKSDKPKNSYSSKTDIITLCSLYKSLSQEETRLLTFHIDGTNFKLKNMYFIVNSLPENKVPVKFLINVTPISGKNKETILLTEIVHQVAKGFNLFELDFWKDPKVPKEMFIVELCGQILNKSVGVELLSVQTHII